jgi:hypothetical protein
MGGQAGEPFFNGRLDEVRLSNTVRYNAAFSPPAVGFTPDANTLALWKLNEGSGQTSADSSGNGYTLTLGTSANADSADPTWVVSTVAGQANAATSTRTPTPQATTSRLLDMQRRWIYLPFVVLRSTIKL